MLSPNVQVSFIIIIITFHYPGNTFLDVRTTLLDPPSPFLFIPAWFTFVSTVFHYPCSVLVSLYLLMCLVSLQTISSQWSSIYISLSWDLHSFPLYFISLAAFWSHFILMCLVSLQNSEWASIGYVSCRCASWLPSMLELLQPVSSGLFVEIIMLYLRWLACNDWRAVVGALALRLVSTQRSKRSVHANSLIHNRQSVQT